MHKLQNYMQIKPGNREEESDPDSEEKEHKEDFSSLLQAASDAAPRTES